MTVAVTQALTNAPDFAGVVLPTTNANETASVFDALLTALSQTDTADEVGTDSNSVVPASAEAASPQAPSSGTAQWPVAIEDAGLGSLSFFSHKRWPAGRLAPTRQARRGGPMQIEVVDAGVPTRRRSRAPHLSQAIGAQEQRASTSEFRRQPWT